MPIELRCKTDNNKIVWYWPSTIGQTSEKCIILAPWLPQYIDKYHPIIKTCEDLHIDLFIVKYTWSWENAWEFSIWQSIEDIENILAFIRSWEWVSIYDKTILDFDYKEIYVLWFSYGALPTVMLPYDPSIKKILLCPFVNYQYHLEWTDGENVRDTLDFIHEWYGQIYNFIPSNFISEAKNINYDKSDKTSEYTVIVGARDHSIPAQEISWLQNNYNITNLIEADISHSLTIDTDTLSKVF